MYIYIYIIYIYTSYIYISYIYDVYIYMIYMIYIYDTYIYICIWYIYIYEIYIYIHTSWLIRTHHAIRLFASLGSRPQQLRERAAADRRREGCNVREACDSGTSIFHTSCQPTRPRSIRGSKKYPLSTCQRTCVRSGESPGQTRVIGTSYRIFVAFTRWLWVEYQLGWKPGKPYLRLTEHTSYSDVTHWKSFWPHWPGNCEHAGRSASCKLRGEFNRILVFFRQYCGRGLTEAFEIITSPLWFCSVEWDQAHVMGLYQNVADFAGLQRWVAFLVFEYVWRFSLFWYAALKRHFWIISDIFYHPRGNGTGSFSRERLSEGFF